MILKIQGCYLQGLASILNGAPENVVFACFALVADEGLACLGVLQFEEFAMRSEVVAVQANLGMLHDRVCATGCPDKSLLFATADAHLVCCDAGAVR